MARYFLVFFWVWISTTLFAGEAFMAISSLRFFLDDDGYEIECTETDIENLFAEAQKSGLKEVHSAYKHYCNQDRKEALSLLDTAWNRLRGKIFAKTKEYYPHLDDNPIITKGMRKKMAPYVLPLTSSLKRIMDQIFSHSRVTYNEQSLAEAGFHTLLVAPNSFLHIALHPLAKGYLFKIALDSELRLKKGRAAWKWLVDRCIGAENIRKLIEKKKLNHFSVPQKWLYPLPYPERAGPISQPVILVVTHFDIFSFEESRVAWLTKATFEIVEELYAIISHGYSSSFLPSNIPYTKEGKFACIDTEYAERKTIKYAAVRKWLSEEMCAYWDNLVRKGGKVQNENSP